MATFTTDTLKSLKARDPREQEELMTELERAQQAAQRRQGGIVTKLDEFERAPVFEKYRAAEQDRRMGAAQGAAQVGSLIDERLAGTANQLQSVYDKYNQARADLMQKQGQAEQATGFETEQGLWNVENQRRGLDFQLFKNQAQRDDAIESLWQQGIAEDKLLDMSINHQLKLQDIEKYFTLKINEIEQDFLDWQQKTKIDWEEKLREMENDASQWGSILSGALGIAGGAAGYFYGGPLGGYAGAKAGSELGAGLGGAVS